MNNIKTSELPLGNLTPNSNTSNFLFVVVDKSTPTTITAIVTETQVAESIFNNNNLIVGTDTYSATLTVNGNSQFLGQISFSDGSIQETAASSVSTTSAIYMQANTAISDIANTNIALTNMQNITYTKTQVDAAITDAITAAIANFASTLYV